MKKTLSALTVMTILTGSLAAPAFATVDFSDVATSSPYYNYIEQLHQANVVSGYPDGTFGPNKTLTRAEFCRFVVSSFNLTQTSASTPFTDISNHWAKTDIAAAYAAGLVAGVTPTTFAPDDNITREQAATIIWRYVSAHGVAATSSNVTVNGTVDSWAVSGVDNIIANKLYGPEVKQSSDGSYDYQATTNMLRQEMAALVETSMQKIGLAAPTGAFTDHVGSSNHPVVPAKGMTIYVTYQGKPSRVTTVSDILNPASNASNLIPVQGQPSTYKIGNIPTLQVTNETGSQNDSATAILEKNINDAANLFAQVTVSINQSQVTYQLPSTDGTNIIWKIELVDQSGNVSAHPVSGSVRAPFGSELFADTATALNTSYSTTGIVYPAASITVMGDLNSPSYTLTYTTLDIN